ncbi:MAG: HDOD domain-containing protein, partial [Planctomycetes bacterium]|nr:HDOD domain-containing protein [Planctomycetota bacterium]
MATILIAEDMALVRESIAAALRHAGHDVLCASNGVEALGILRGQVPDLLLLDINMPEMSGIDLLKKIRASESLPNPPTVFLTEAAERDLVLEARSLGVHHYLLKSEFSLDDLFVHIKAALSGDEPETPSSTDTSPVIQRRAPANITPQASKSTTTESKIVTDAEPQPRTRHRAKPSVDASEALKSLKPLMTRSQLKERLESCDALKAFSPSVSEVLKLSRSATATIEQFAAAIKRDQAISLVILKLANSAAYTRGKPADSIDKAVMRIGTKAIGQVVLNISVIESLSTDTERSELDVRQFWEHAISCGIIAAKIASALGEKEPDRAFTMGLIHDVGRLIYSELLGSVYSEVKQVAGDLGLPLEQVESRLLLLNHADGVDQVLQAWRFPRDLIDPVVSHHLSFAGIQKIAPQRRREAAILALANRLSHALLIGTSGNDTVYPVQEFCDGLKIEPGTIADIEQSTRDQTDDIKLAMLAAGGQGPWPDQRSAVRDRLRSPFRPLFVSANPEMDTYRIFCDQLRDAADAAPNVGVLHLAHARECSPLWTTYSNAEADAGVADVVPQPADGVEVAGHRVVTARGVLQIDRHLGFEVLQH